MSVGDQNYNADNWPHGYSVPKQDHGLTPTPVLGTQVGGSHYTKHAIQPIEYIWANGIGFSEGNIIKYVTRWKDKGGVQDLKKARHHLDLLIEREERGLQTRS